jgi:hypothetical protein
MIALRCVHLPFSRLKLARWVFAGTIVAIRKHITGSDFDADTTRIMIEAYECARKGLDLPPGDSDINMRIADLVLHLAQAGERDAEVICKRVMMQLP